MIFNFTRKGTGMARGVTFRAAKDGGLVLDRKSLHESPGFQRQLKALEVISANMKKKPRPAE